MKYEVKRFVLYLLMQIIYFQASVGLFAYHAKYMYIEIVVLQSIIGIWIENEKRYAKMFVLLCA